MAVLYCRGNDRERWLIGAIHLPGALYSQVFADSTQPDRDTELALPAENELLVPAKIPLMPQARSNSTS